MSFDQSYDTNGGANRFWVNNGKLFVWGQGVSGTKELTGSDNSAFLAGLFGGTLLSNGNVGAADGRTPLNAAGSQLSITKEGDSWIVNFGNRFVSGSEKYAFKSEAHANKFVSVLTEIDLGTGLLDEII